VVGYFYTFFKCPLVNRRLSVAFWVFYLFYVLHLRFMCNKSLLTYVTYLDSQIKFQFENLPTIINKSHSEDL